MSGSEVVLPIWLSSVRNRLKESSSWRELCSSVFDATKSECSRNNVAYLSDVSVGAKGLIMDAVEKRLEEEMRRAQDSLRSTPDGGTPRGFFARLNRRAAAPNCAPEFFAALTKFFFA